MNESFGELGGRMTFINISDSHVFEILPANGPNGQDELNQVFPRVGIECVSAVRLPQGERGRPGHDTYEFSLIQ
jgi:hypothetical protein